MFRVQYIKHINIPFVYLVVVRGEAHGYNSVFYKKKKDCHFLTSVVRRLKMPLLPEDERVLFFYSVSSKSTRGNVIVIKKLLSIVL